MEGQTLEEWPIIRTMTLRKASFNLPRNRNCLETWSRKVLAHRFPQNQQSHSRRTEWPKRTTVRWQSRKTEAMEEVAVRETPTAFCFLDYSWRRGSQTNRIERKESGEKTLSVKRRSNPSSNATSAYGPVRGSRMVTSRHPWGPRIGILIFLSAGGAGVGGGGTGMGGEERMH